MEKTSQIISKKCHFNLGIANLNTLNVFLFNLENKIISQVVVVGRFHSFTPSLHHSITPSLPVRHLEPGGGGGGGAPI